MCDAKIIDIDYFINNNPWKKFKENELFIVDDDIEKLKKTKTTRSKKNIYDILSKQYFGDIARDMKEIIDSPINGNPFKAKIILLYNNPSLPNIKGVPYDTSKKMKDDYYHNDQIDVIKDNLSLSEGATLLFTGEKSKKINGGKKWYDHLYKSILNEKKDYKIENFREDICTLQWFPYPSNKFQEDFISTGLNEIIRTLDTHQFMVDLARFAIASGKTVIAMRNVVLWSEVLSYKTIKSEKKLIKVENTTVNENAYDELYRNNFFISLDNINQGIKVKYLTKPLPKAEQIDFDKLFKP
ncbi:MAG: hypothetical protein AB7U52_05515 [Candidatus Izemoplasmatales bacterium]